MNIKMSMSTKFGNVAKRNAFKIYMYTSTIVTMSNVDISYKEMIFFFSLPLMIPTNAHVHPRI